MSEEKGLSVAEKRFKITLPVSGIDILLKYSTRADKSAAVQAAEVEKSGSALTKEDRFELTYFSRIIVEPKFTMEQLSEMPEKDITAIRIADSRINDITKEEAEALVKDFAIALK